MSQLLIDQTITASNHADAGAVTTASFSTNFAQEILVALVTCDAIGSNTCTVTGAGLTWTLNQRTNTQNGSAEIWTAFSPVILSSVTVKNTVTATNSDCAITVVTLSGVNVNTQVGAVATANSGSGTPSLTLQTLNASSWVFAVVANNSNNTSGTAGSNQTLMFNDLDSNDATASYMIRQNASTSASGTIVTMNITAPAGLTYNMSAIEIIHSWASFQPIGNKVNNSGERPYGFSPGLAR